VIEIRYTQGHGVEISGSAEELAYARRTVLAMLELGKPSVGIQAGFACDPAPFETALHLLVFKRGDGPLRRYVVGRRALVVEGSAESLARFAGRLALVGGTRAAGGREMPSSSGPTWVAPDALPASLVLRP